MSDISAAAVAREQYTPMTPGERALLIRLDAGFIARIDAEREVLTGGTGHRIARTTMIRVLINESLKARARARGEKVPEAVTVSP